MKSPRYWFQHLFHHKRRYYLNDGRMHLELRDIATEQLARLDKLYQQQVMALDGVHWCVYNQALHRFVVCFDPARVDVALLQTLLDRCERALDIRHRPFRKHFQYPGDQEPVVRALIELGADVAGLGVGLGLRLLPKRRVTAWMELSALLLTVENVDTLSRPLIGYLGQDNFELLLSVANSFTEALGNGWTGSFADVFHRLHQLQYYRTRRTYWQEWEARLCSERRFHPGVGALRVEGRRSAVPDGIVEKYEEEAMDWAAGGFSFGLVATRNFEPATASLFAGAPRPARAGRRSFTIELSRLLMETGMMVMRPHKIKLLDRITTVLMDGELLKGHVWGIADVYLLQDMASDELVRCLHRLFIPENPFQQSRHEQWLLAPVSAIPVKLDESARHWFLHSGNTQTEPLVLSFRHTPMAYVAVQAVIDPLAEAIVGAVRKADLELAIANHHGPEFEWALPDMMVDQDHLVAEIHDLQERGRCVLYVSAQASPAFYASDLGLGVLDASGAMPPWGADIITRQGMQDVLLCINAMSQARKAAQQSVELARIEAFSGLIMALRGLDERSIARIRAAANAATLLAMCNGVRLVRGLDLHPAPRPRDLTPWHMLSAEDCLQQLGTAALGLASDQVVSRLLIEPPPPSLLRQFLATWVQEMSNPLAPILFAGAALSALTGAAGDAGIIVSVIGLNAVLGAVQRQRTERAMAALDQREQQQVRVLRDGEWTRIDADTLVPGDILVLEAGESVPADCRLLLADSVETDESSLTGESLPVAKSIAPTFAPALGDRTCMLYEGTSVIAGRAEAVVVAVGALCESQRARWQKQLHSGQATGVEARLDAITAMTAPVAAISGIAVMASGLMQHRPANELISAGVSLAVAAVPEGLPLLATMAQLSSAHRLSRRGALVRNPRAVEALGRTNLLCADKTGTLTEGQLSLQKLANGHDIIAIDAGHPDVQRILIAACNASPDGLRTQTLPHVTDAALFKAARNQQLHTHPDCEQWQRLQELPFKSERGYHAVLGQDHNGQRRILVKGAPEKLLPLLTQEWRDGNSQPLQPADRERIEQQGLALAASGCRVLAIAEQPAGDLEILTDADLREMTFLGYVGLMDPVRSTAPAAVQTLKRAGVEVVMITGDHPRTAQAIGTALGLSHPDAILTGAELDRLSEAELDQRLDKVSVFARVSPAQKARIVRGFQRIGRVVAMTGDGANDAPAIRLADVGIALGEHSTTAARAACDVLVSDERIETIVDAVLEGRALWKSVRDAVSVLVGGNLGEIGFTLIAGLLYGQSPLNARQLMLVNLLTDTLPALAIALRRPDTSDPDALLKEGPEHSLGRELLHDVELSALVTSIVASINWGVARLSGSPQRASTIALLGLVGSQLGQTLFAAKGSANVIATALGSLAVLMLVVETPGVSQFFGCRPLGPVGLIHAAGSVAISLAANWGVPKLEHEIRDWMQHMTRHVETAALPAIEPVSPVTLHQTEAAVV
ncbi:MAG: cation-transporting P-type ATPase [Gammaproteobacteria bacterium]